jgi:CHAT domain-containing protein
LPPGQCRFLGIENPTGDLQGASAEVRKVKTWFQLPQILCGDDVTRKAVLRDLPNVDIAHFACHGHAHVTRPLESALILANNEKLTVADMLGADARLRLAVLSACSTGLAGDDLPDELVSLSTGFLEAGAEAVIASLWQVPDASTRELMTRFYSLWLGSELHPAEALRRAQQKVRDSTLAEKERFAAAERALPFCSARDVISVQNTRDWADQERPFADPRFWAAFAFMGVA